MSEKIPDSSQTNNYFRIETHTARDSGVDLAPVVISASRRLFHLHLLMYSAMLLSASVAIFPFILTSPYWLILWLVFVVLLAMALGVELRKKQQPPIRLSVIQKVWRVHTDEGEVQVKPFDEILLWDAVIILPVREVLTQRKHRIVVLSDAMSPDDWRRLRVWLRMGLKEHL